MATILVVDDHPDNRTFLEMLLGYAGYRMLATYGGAEALEIVRAQRPDLVIADVLMPKMDGFEFVRALRADPAIAQTRVMFYTAVYNEAEARALALGYGVEHFLSKPAAPQIIVQTVAQALEGAGAPGAPDDGTLERAHRELINDKLIRTIAQLEALIELGCELAVERDSQRLLELVARASCTIIGAGYAVVGIVAEHGLMLDHFAIGGPDIQAVDAVTWPSIEHGIINALMAARRPLRRRNPGGAPETLGLPADHPPVYSFLGVPIVTPARVYGWLGLRNKRQADEFSAEDERIATTLAGQVAVAYENALRYEAIQRHTAELEQRVQERTTELRRSNADLEQFAYVAAHDLQEPLRKVVGYTQLLQRRYGDRLDGEAAEFLRIVVDGASRMRTLIQDLLAYSRIGTRDRAVAPVDCGAALDQALRHLETAIEESGAEIARDALPTVPANLTQLTQLFQNLIGNALKFRGAGPPRVWVTARRQTGAGAGEWVFAVRDNGIGIEPQYVDRIFGVFQRLHTRTEYPGTGIGLAICKKIVERHGGRIWVESQPGQGATFSFTIPVEGA